MSEPGDPRGTPGEAARTGRPAASSGAAEPLPPDPVEYDSERNALARARGLAAPYIAGGRDPDPEAGRREERFYGRLLVIMVALIVASGFVLGFLANILGSMGPR